ncbi:hypothetical protein FB451DRAFT_1398890 [Mycena latifolia]|nr:hypothetical protein FB451DRAFT_1398890 [Mycena latifolia]
MSTPAEARNAEILESLVEVRARQARGIQPCDTTRFFAAIPNLYAIQTLTSAKAATALNKSLPPERTSRGGHAARAAHHHDMSTAEAAGPQALEQSLNAGDENADFERLNDTRGAEGTGRLLLSMGMSSDFEAALKAARGSDIVRVGTGIFETK